jgi:hypothetical protein
MPYNDPLLCRLSQKFEKEMPAQLTAEQKVVQHAMITMVENHFHW